jgi:hypothetical protein
MLRRAVRSQAFDRILVDGTWNVPTTLDSGGRHMECAYYSGFWWTAHGMCLLLWILGGRHMECAYYFEFCRLCRDCSKYFDSTIDSTVRLKRVARHHPVGPDFGNRGR